MITNISWTDYFIAVTILLAVYYLFIGIRYHSVDLKNLLSAKWKRRLKTVIPNNLPVNGLPFNEENSHLSKVSFEETTDEEFNEVEHLIERLKSVIADASQRKLMLQEFKQYLGMVLKEYPAVKYSPLRSSINELIISECQKYGTVMLTEEEVDLLWNDSK